MDPITDWTLRLGWILPAWLFALGATIGSFLNVVVYRLPAGKSIVHPGSLCPACGHPIRWYHNLPIASWFVLRGHCYDCRAKISPRYPMVELVTAVMFLGLFLADARPRLLAPAGGASVLSRCSRRWHGSSRLAGCACRFRGCLTPEPRSRAGQRPTLALASAGGDLLRIAS
jgi:hypothetical protein